MNMSELHDALKLKSDETFRALILEFGGDSKTRADLEREFVDHPEYERRICQLLGLATEGEKLVKATEAGASSAELSARAAWVSAVMAFVAFVVALIAVVWHR